MSASDRQEFEQLLADLYEGERSPAQGQRLEELLLHHPKFRTEYLAYVKTHLLMSAEFAEPASANPLPTATQPAGHKVSPLTLTYWRERPIRFGTLALALTLLLWVGFYFTVLRNGAATRPQDLASSHLARVTDIRGVAWAKDATAWQPGAELNAGDTLELASGFVEITFVDGAVVLLEAPFEFTVDSRGAGTLEHGRLVARIEKQADGSEAIPFSISTPLAQIIDLGTKFGVEASESGEVEVEVFLGKVEVMPRSSPDVRRPQSLMLTEGQTAQLRPGNNRFVRSEAPSNPFTQQMPTEVLTLIAPVRLTTTATQFFGPPERLIDGSGLLEHGHPSQWRHEFEQPASSWSSNASELPVTFTFDLGQEYDLKNIWIWNLCNPQADIYVGHNTKEVRVEVSSDGREFSPWGTITLTACTVHPTPAESFEFEQRTRYVRFVVLSNYNSNAGEVQLSEVRFEIAPAEENKPQASTPQQ